MLQDALLSQGESRDATVNFEFLTRIEFYSGIARFLRHSTAFLLVFVCKMNELSAKSDKP